MKKLILLLAIVSVNIFFIAERKQRIAFERHEAMIVETNACLNAGDWKCVEKNVRELLKTSPNDTNLQMHLAGVLFEQERYKECVQYVQSLNFRNSELNYFVEKSLLLEREMENLGVEKSMHFRLEFDGTPTKKDVMEALAVLEVAYDSLSNLFDYMPENKMCVVLYQEKEFQGVGPRPDWVGAIFDGKLRIPVNLMEYREVYRPVLFHELTHAFVRSMTRSELPFWLNEGIAQVIDGMRKNWDRPEGATPSLKMLTEQFVQHSSTELALKLYWYSKKMVEELLRRGGGGTDVFRKFTLCMQDIHRLGFDKSLQTHFGVTAEELLESVK